MKRKIGKEPAEYRREQDKKRRKGDCLRNTAGNRTRKMAEGKEPAEYRREQDKKRKIGTEPAEYRREQDRKMAEVA